MAESAADHFKVLLLHLLLQGIVVVFVFEVMIRRLLPVSLIILKVNRLPHLLHDLAESLLLGSIILVRVVVGGALSSESLTGGGGKLRDLRDEVRGMLAVSVQSIDATAGGSLRKKAHLQGRDSVLGKGRRVF